MDLLKTLLVYLALTFTASVESTPAPASIPDYKLPTPTPYVAEAQATPTPVPTPSPTPVPTINITPNPAYKTIQSGDKGDEVIRLQQALAEYGYYDGEIDGRFGNQTRAAVMAFQYQHGLVADGFAGRSTLTVLYESNEVRPAPKPDATPEPEPTSELTVAFTLPPREAAPTPEPSVQPAELEPEPTQEPVPEPTAAPTAQPAPTFAPIELVEPAATPVPRFEPIEDGKILVEDAIVMLPAKEGETAATALPYTYGDTLCLPLMQVLGAADVSVISTTDIRKDEYAFALGSDLYRLSFTETVDGQPVELEAYRNAELQPLVNGSIWIVDDVLYFSAADVESLTGITAEKDANTSVVTVTLPVLD